MGAVWLSAVSGLRHRAAAVVALVVLLAVTGGVVIVAMAGARRADTAFERFLAASVAPEIDVALAEPGDPSLADEIGAIDGVEGTTLAAYVATAPVEGGLVPFRDTIAFAIVASSGTGGQGLLMDEGRPLGDDPDEVLLNRSMADIAGVEVGDDVELWSLSPEAGVRGLEAGVDEVDGPRTTAVVAGIFRAAEDVSDNPEPVMIVPAAYTERYAVASLPLLAGVRAEDGRENDVIAALQALLPDATIAPSQRLDRRIDDGIGVQALGLFALGVAVAVAGVAAVVQLVSRLGAAEATDDQVRGALGMTLAQRRGIAALRAVPIAVAGAGAAAVAGIVAGPLAITGLARQAEPDRGVHVDATVAIAVAVLLVAVTTGAAAAGVRRRRTAQRGPAVSGLDRAVLGSGLPLVAALGARRALGRTTARWSDRAGLVAVVASFAVVVSVLTFDRSVDELLRTPSDWGAEFDAFLAPGPDSDEFEAAAADLAVDDRVRDVAIVQEALITVRTSSGEEISLGATSADPTKGGGDFLPVVDGRLPGADDEVAVGASVLHDLDLRIGDPVTVEAAGGTHTFRIVGRAVTYSFDSIDEGVITTPGALRLLDPAGAQPSLFLVRFASGVDDEAMLADLEARYTDVGPALRPGSVDNLDELGLLPLVLAALVTGLGALAGGLALTAATSRSRRELATLLALGASRGQVGRTVVAHGITLAGVAIVLGTPIGVGIGRAVYRAVADGIGAIVRPAVPLASVAALAAGAVLAAIVLATPPALAAARRRPALALRNE